MSSRHVRKWMIAAPIIGWSILGCGSSHTVFTGLGGSNSGGTSSGGTSAEQGGSGGANSAGTGGSTAGTGASGGSAGNSAGGTGGTGGTSDGTGGTGGTAPDFDYEPFGIGDPWFFSSEDELDAFTISYELGATGTASWNDAGEIHIPVNFTQAGDKVFIHFTQEGNAPMDLSQRVLRARVRLASGATATGGVEPYSQSSGWTWGAGDWNSFADLGEFVDVEYDFADKATSATDVLRFGLQVLATGAGDVEVIIDDIRLEPKDAPPEGDGGVPPEGDAGVPPEGDAGVPPESDAGVPPESDAGAGDDGGGGGLGYEPVGIGDPWFFDTESEMNQFTFAKGNGGATLGTRSLVDGEVHLPATYSAQNDTVQFYINTPWNGSINTADMTGRVLKVNVRIGAGATITGGGVQLFIQSNNWNQVHSGWNSISGLGTTTEVSMPLSDATNAADVQQIGIQLNASSAGTADLIVDDIRLEPAP